MQQLKVIKFAQVPLSYNPCNTVRSLKEKSICRNLLISYQGKIRLGTAGSGVGTVVPRLKIIDPLRL
jgi:hypothetical protein